MSLKLKISEVNKVEEQGLSIFEFDRINWWPLIRVFIFQNYELQKHSVIDKSKLIYPKRVLWEIKIWMDLKKKIKQAKVTVCDKFIPVDTCFFTSETNYKKDAYNKYINRFLDPLYIKTPGSKVIFVRSKKIADNYSVETLFETEYIELQLKLKKQIAIIFRTLFFFSTKITYSDIHKLHIENIINHIKSFSYFKNYNFSLLPKWFDAVFDSYDVAQLIFKYLKPKLFIQYCYYFPNQFGYTLAANSLNIKSIDYQHGIQNKYHYGYGSWVNVPTIGYQLLPSEFWVFSDREEINLLASFSKSTHRIKVIGNAWIDYWKDHKTDYDNLSWLHQLKSRGFKIILYTLSNNVLDRSHFFWKYLKRCNSANYYFLFRLHPGYVYINDTLVNRLQEINFVNYNIIESSKTELYDLLNECDIHITQNSTVAEEALYFKKKSIIIDSKWMIYFESYILKGEMFFANNVLELDDILNKEFKI